MNKRDYTSLPLVLQKTRKKRVKDALFGILAPAKSGCQTEKWGKYKRLWQDYAQHRYIDKLKKPVHMLFAALVESGSITAYIPIAVVTICMFCGASWIMFWTATDPARFQCYALTFWLGSSATNLLPASQCAFLHVSTPLPSFHLLPTEYPPLTLIPFSLALLMPVAYYQWAFALLMSLVSALTYWLLLHYGPRGAGVVFAFYLFIGALATAQARFDLIPAALTLMCLIAAERKHWRAAYIALAFAVLIKMYPLLLLPVLFIAEQQSAGKLTSQQPFTTLSALIRQLLMTVREVRDWRWQNCLLCLGIIAAITGGFALLNFQGAVISQISYFVDRPIQIEATGSTLLWLAKGLGVPLWFGFSYGSINSFSPLSVVVERLSTCGFVLGCLYVCWLQWHKRLDLTQAAVALLLLFVATGKVFSPQYLIWLMPLLAYAGAFDAFWLLLWGSVSLLTTIIFIFFYSHIDTTDPLIIQPLILSLHGFFEIMATRNLLFVFITLAYLFNWFQVRQRRPVAVGESIDGRVKIQPHHHP